MRTFYRHSAAARLRAGGAWLGALLLGACAAEPTLTPGYAVAVQELSLAWKLVPHRLSLVELAALPGTAAAAWTVAAQQNGGSFGALDRYSATLGYAVLAAPGLRAYHGRVEVAIPAGRAEGDAEATVALDDAPRDAALLPVLRGVRVSSAEYATPPPWIERYDPALGYTTTGLGVRLHPAQRSGAQATFKTSAAVRFAPCDREDPAAGDDMNGTVPLAASWVTVEYSLLLVPRAEVTAAEHEYFVSYRDFGKNGVHVETPAAEARTQRIAGRPGLPAALVALQGFDLLANEEQHKAPDCPIVQGPECKGPGRYLQTLRAALRPGPYDPASGVATVEHDHMLSNDAPDGTKTFEQGTLCARVRGHAALVQLPDGAVNARRWTQDELLSGERVTQPLDVCGATPTDVACP